MASVLDKIHRLLALSTSSNENEARSAALAACRLIREHEVVLRLPATEQVPTPQVPFVVKRPKGPKVRDLYNVEWNFYDEWGGGGNCLFCALPCFRGSAVYSSGDQLLHLLCWTSRQTGKTKPGPAPVTSVPASSRTPATDPRSQKSLDDFWETFEKTRR